MSFPFKNREMYVPKFRLAVFISALILLACGCGKSGRQPKVHTLSKSTTRQSQQGTNLSPIAQKGRIVAQTNGCFKCHTTNGKDKTGPTLKNLYGRQTTLKDGSHATVDSSYIIQSLKYPDAKITAGYSGVMPKYQFLTDTQMRQLVAYIKALSKQEKDHSTSKR